MIEQAKEKDIEKLNEIIENDYPYKNFSNETLSDRIRKPGVIILKKTYNKELAGFVDFEVKENFGLINAVSVKKSYRRKGFGKELLEKALDVLKQNNIFEAKLLVKQENAQAKKLYESIGFTFIKIHDKKIQNSLVEVWGIELLIDDMGYLN